jgi:hypothetical protein
MYNSNIAQKLNELIEVVGKKCWNAFPLALATSRKTCHSPQRQSELTEYLHNLLMSRQLQRVTWIGTFLTRIWSGEIMKMMAWEAKLRMKWIW